MGFLKGSQMLQQNCEQKKLYTFKKYGDWSFISRISWYCKHFKTSAISSPFYTDKTFSQYEFLVQLLFTPRFKQRHIPRYNYAKLQQ